MKKFGLFALTILWALMVVGAAAADDFKVKDAAVFYKGRKVEGSRIMGGTSVTDPNGRALLWAAVDGNETTGFKGAPTGLYFFWGHEEFDGDGVMQNAEGQFAFFLPQLNPEQADLGFSADGRYFFVSLGNAPLRDLTVYEFDGFKKIKNVKAMDQPIWSPEWDGRLVFTLVDEAKGERSPERGMQAPGWMSVVVYDPAVDIPAPVAEATDLADYMLDSIDEETRQMNISEYSVKSPADWAKEDAVEIKRIKAKFPPFG